MPKRLFFAALTLLLTLLVAEALARLFLAHATPTGYDAASWRAHWMQNHAAAGDLYYAFDTHDPLLGWRSRPGLRDEPAFGNQARLSTNELGLRGAATPSLLPAPGVRRILVLGDSFTFGEDVEDDETFAALLDQSLPRSEVLNFGVHGFGHDQMLLLFREVGRKYSPEIVILAFVYDDIYRNLVSFRDFAKPRFTLRDDELALSNVPVPTPEEILASSWKRVHLFDALEMGWAWFEFGTGRVDARAQKLSIAILDALLEEIRSAGARPLFVYLPVRDEMKPDTPGVSRGEVFLTDFCASRAVPCLFLGPVLRDAVARGIETPDRLHWGPGGHLAAARRLHHYLRATPPGPKPRPGTAPVKNPGFPECAAADDSCP